MFISSPKVIAEALKRGFDGARFEIDEQDVAYITDCVLQALVRDSAGFNQQGFIEVMRKPIES